VAAGAKAGVRDGQVFAPADRLIATVVADFQVAASLACRGLP